MENVRNSKQNKINTSGVSFSEGKLNCPKKSTDDEIHLQNAILLFTAYKRMGTETLLANINKVCSKCKRSHLRNVIQPCNEQKEIEDVHVHRYACTVYAN